jgi:hypothetical protein
MLFDRESVVLCVDERRVKAHWPFFCLRSLLDRVKNADREERSAVCPFPVQFRTLSTFPTIERDSFSIYY